jgi:transcription elongation GreA/GreB family factor
MLETLRQKIKELNTHRDKAIMQKGLAAEDNKDLRENAEYDYWVEKELFFTAQIITLIKEIQKLTKKPTVTPKTSAKSSKPQLIKDLPKNKWL